MISLKPYVKFLIDNSLTQGQYLLLTLLYEKEFTLLKEFKAKFPHKEGSMISKSEIADLVTKGFLIKHPKGYKIGDKFKKVFVTSEKAVQQIYDLYPNFMLSDKNVDIPLTSMDMNIFAKLYIPKINGSIEEHEEVLKDIQYGIDNSLIKVGLNKFVTSNYWRTFRERRITATSPTNALRTKDF